VIELRGVSKSFEDEVAIHPMDLTIELGKTTVLIGPSGCGKSTLLRLMLGLTAPDAGQVLFDGTAFFEHADVDALRRRLGYVVQRGGLFPHLTASQNVMLVGTWQGTAEVDLLERLVDLAELAHLPIELLGKKPDELSGGQRQRVALMRALFLDPEVLLLDEPLGALDSRIRSGLQTDLRDVFQDLGKTVVMVTHDMGEAAFFADVIVLLRDGRVVQKGAFKELIEAPAEPWVTEFIAAQRPPLNEL
jgi:osmoprotectant transport system ATP-binding protein